MPWIVKLVKEPTRYVYRRGFFPRKYHYKRDALDLVQEVKSNGGEAVCEPVAKESHEKPTCTSN